MELYVLSKQDLSILSICKVADYQINLDEETNAKSTFTLVKTDGLKEGNFLVLNGLYRQFLFVIPSGGISTEKGSDTVTVTALDISNIFDRKVIEKNTDIMTTNSIEEFIANTMSENFVNSDDIALNVGYINIYWKTNTQAVVATNAENGLYNFHTFLINCRQYKNIYTNFKFEDGRLKIDIENKEETIEMIDTTLPEVVDYNKVYEEDVTAKVQVYIREDGSEYNLYLKTDRTTTTNQDDPDRANGNIEVISVDTADRAEEEALNVMKGNNYKHLVEFKIAKTSKLMDITKLHIGRPILIKTDDDIYESYISAITLSDENFVYFKSGSLRITLLDKLKKNANNTGNKLDISGGKIKGNLSIDGNFEVNGVNIVAGVSGDTLPIGSVMEWDSDTIPVNWLLLNGQAVSRIAYNELFKLYGTRYGEGDGSTTFNLPNRKTRVSVGKDSADTDFNTLGKIGGEKTHKLTVSEMPAHNHGMTWNTGSDSSASAVSWVSATATQVVNTKKTGGDGAHNNLQPYFVTNFIVKAKQNPGVVATVIDNLESISEIDALSAKQGKVLNDSKLDTSSNLTNTEIETLINNIIL